MRFSCFAQKRMAEMALLPKPWILKNRDGCRRDRELNLAKVASNYRRPFFLFFQNGGTSPAMMQP